MDLLSAHIEGVSENWRPFEVTLGGFQLRHDWLYLLLQEGADVIARMNQEVYTGYLTPYRKPPREGSEFVAHIGLGLFVKPGRSWDWRAPKESDADTERYQEALLWADILPLPETALVEAVCITAIPDVVTEFTAGKRADFPDDGKMVRVREYRLG